MNRLHQKRQGSLEQVEEMQPKSYLWSRVAQEKIDLIEKHLNTVPVPVGALASDLGLEVKSVALEPTISGEIGPSQTAPCGYKIRVNRHEKKARQRYTIAHEIAHYLLHREHIGDGISDNVLYRSALSNEIEREANRLAADLVMPRSAVAVALEELGGVATEEVAGILAQRFEVSLPAMKIRLGVS